MRRHKYIIIGVMACLLLASCGKQGDAEALVKAFIEQNAVDHAKMTVLDFGKLDSTKVIKDSLIQAMQSRDNQHFKQGIDYPLPTKGRMLYFLRMKYVYDNDTLQHTFYLDEALQRVVAFK